jgi:deoxycytidylate deaminase|tara:strand:- start:536 stop:934 length:399 start_codon:yes stop_codon:yes gene_type:complete
MLQNWVVVCHYRIPIVVKKSVNGKLSYTRHAEVAVLLQWVYLLRRRGYKDADIRRKLGKECLIVVRINNDKSSSIPFKNSAPCSECITKLRQYNIQKIMYSLDDGTFHFERVRDLGEGRLSSGARALLRSSH